MKQHFVPKVYLKRFAVKNKNEYIVEVYDKKEEKFFKVNTENILSVTNLYTLDPSNNKSNNPLIVEKIYSDFIEPLYEKSIKILLDDSRTYISNLERAEILISILHLYHRNPNNFKKLINAHIEIINTMYLNSINENKLEFSYLDETYKTENFNIDEIKEKIELKINKIFKENHLDLTAKFGEIHEFTAMEVFKCETQGNFFTNDNPIHFQDFLNTEANNPFLISAEFTIPLTKKYFLKLSHDNTKKVNYIYRYKISDFHVNLINDQTCKTASRFVICNKNDFIVFLEDKKIIDDISIHRKMDLLKQVIEHCEKSNLKDEYYKLIKYYYIKYLEQNNHLDKIDEYNLMMRMKELNKQKKASLI
ncbi:DUF4238 domain-containing protein [Flavobacterium helocola]|uniref:DUF4238 domain-containing protein n=1 Tax=Flavobacterium helocola TaxID=3139139 RepID=A0ABU9I9X3_9FLAO